MLAEKCSRNVLNFAESWCQLTRFFHKIFEIFSKKLKQKPKQSNKKEKSRVYLVSPPEASV